MTAKRDLKKRVRDRQAQTGESYVTARRNVVAAVEPSAAAAAPAMQVVEMLDHSDAAARLGLRCKVSMSSTLAALVDPALALTSVRDALVGTEGDPETAVLRGVALGGKHPPLPKRRPDFEDVTRFFRRARAGLGGVSADGTMLALLVAGQTGMVPLLCTVWHRQVALLLTTFDDEHGEDSWDSRFAQLRGRPVPVAPAVRALFCAVGGKLHEVTKLPCVIGRGPAADLRLTSPGVSELHASISFRHGSYFLSDLASQDGVFYRGMRIDNKRIDEGDVFTLGDVDLRFTYVASQ